MHPPILLLWDRIGRTPRHQKRSELGINQTKDCLTTLAQLWLSQVQSTIMAMSLMVARFCFSSSKNYVNQFKVRSRLAQFFKHIHPDQMAQAPTKIKEENLRSLKNFNSYLDSINQQKPIDGKLLKFYISQKTNNKGRKFFSFTVELPTLNAEQAQMEEPRAQQLIDDIVNALNSKFAESRGILGGKKKEKVGVESEVRVETPEERLQRMQQTTGPAPSSFKRYIQEESLRQAINAKFMETEREDLKLKLRQNMAYANTPSNKPMMWSRILMEESGIYGDYQRILEHLIDPKLIFFSENIGLPEIEEFKRKLLPGELDRLGIRATQAVLQVCEEMESYSPPICLFVTTHYSATEIPGFFSVPYNFVPTEMLQHFQQCKNIILQQRSRYEEHYETFQDLCKELLTSSNIRIKQPTFRNNADISDKLIAIKRLFKVKADNVIDLHLYDHQDFKILCKQYNLENDKTAHLLNRKIFLLTQFKDEHLKELLQQMQPAHKQAQQ